MPSVAGNLGFRLVAEDQGLIDGIFLATPLHSRHVVILGFRAVSFEASQCLGDIPPVVLVNCYSCCYDLLRRQKYHLVHIEGSELSSRVRTLLTSSDWPLSIWNLESTFKLSDLRFLIF